MSSDLEPKDRTPTDIIVDAMECAENMEYCVVIYKMKENSGCGWLSNVQSRDTRIGILYEAQFLMLTKTYGLAQDSE